MFATPLVALGLDPFRAGQISAALLGALAIWPTVRAAQVIEPRWATGLAWLLALSPLPIRFGAMCLSEPAFHLVGALASENWSVRSESARILSGLGDAARAPLEQAAGSSNKNVSYWAAHALRQM